MRKSERARWETLSSFSPLKAEGLKFKFHAWKVFSFPLFRSKQHLACKKTTKGMRSCAVVYSSASAHVQLLHLNLPLLYIVFSVCTQE